MDPSGLAAPAAPPGLDPRPSSDKLPPFGPPPSRPRSAQRVRSSRATAGGGGGGERTKISAVYFGCGQNFFSQLHGGEDAPRHLDTPQKLDFLEELQPHTIAAGGRFSLAVPRGQPGVLYRWGTDNGRVYRQPERVNFLPVKVRAVSCGAKHTLLLLDSGHVLTFGTGYFGQLGHGDDASINAPKVVAKLDPARLSGDVVVRVAAGGNHSGAVTHGGQVFMWGFNRSGQCGVGSKANTISQPRLVLLQEDTGPDQLGRPVQLVCGRHHSTMLLQSGAVFSWGASSFGRLGLHDQSQAQVRAPKRITTLDHFAVMALAAGDFHMLALTKDRRVFSWGYSAEGQCGHGNSLHLRTPRPIEALRNVLVSQIACGAWSSACISADGVLYTWGYGDGGWLGHPDPTKLGAQLPVVEAGGPLQRKSSEACSFDSRHNVMRPRAVDALRDMQVTQVACGGGHLLCQAIKRDSLAMPVIDSSVQAAATMAGTKVDGVPTLPPRPRPGTAVRASDSIAGATLDYGGFGNHGRVGAADTVSGADLDYDQTANGGRQTWDSHASVPDHSKEEPVGLARLPHQPVEPQRPPQQPPQQPEPERLRPASAAASVVAESAPLPNSGAGLASEPRPAAESVVDVWSGGGFGDAVDGLLASRKDGVFQPLVPQSLDADSRLLYTRQVLSYGRHGRTQEVQAALDNGFVVDEQDDNSNTLLLVAAQNGLKPLARLCLKYGANPNQANHRGNTPLHYCFKYQHQDLAAYLIKKGADDGATNKDGLTPYEGLSLADLGEL